MTCLKNILLEIILFSLSVAIWKIMTDNGDSCGISLCKGFIDEKTLLNLVLIFLFDRKEYIKLIIFGPNFHSLNCMIKCFFKIDGY